MGSKVSSYDFSQYKRAMVAKGMSSSEVDACWRDLLVFLNAIEDSADGRAFALTEGADKALHELVSDTAGLLRFSGAVIGAGHVMTHDPNCYGTPEFVAAWANTRAAFAAEGVDLPKDYLSTAVGDFRSAATCVVYPTLIGEIQAAA